LAYYARAIPAVRETGDRAAEEITLNNIGGVYDGLGDWRQAMTYHEQALPIRNEPQHVRRSDQSEASRPVIGCG